MKKKKLYFWRGTGLFDQFRSNRASCLSVSILILIFYFSNKFKQGKIYKNLSTF